MTFGFLRQLLFYVWCLLLHYLFILFCSFTHFIGLNRGFKFCPCNLRVFIKFIRPPLTMHIGPIRFSFPRYAVHSIIFMQCAITCKSAHCLWLQGRPPAKEGSFASQEKQPRSCRASICNYQRYVLPPALPSRDWGECFTRRGRRFNVYIPWWVIVMLITRD